LAGEVDAFEAPEPAAAARSPTSGIANAATASTSSAVKIALFMFIRLSLSKGLEIRFKVSVPDGARRAAESGSILSNGTFSDYDPEILAPTASRLLCNVYQAAPIGANRLSDGFSFPVLLKLKVLVVPWALP
jgi:hypothetical protein